MMVEGYDGPVRVDVGDTVSYKGDMESTGEILSIRGDWLTVRDYHTSQTHMVRQVHVWVE